MTNIVIKVYQNPNELPPSNPLPDGMKFVRVLHEVELPPNKRYTPLRQPEVRPLFPNHFSWFGRGWQLLSWDMNGHQYMNAGNMTAIYNEALWIANNWGFGNVPRANYFTMEDLEYDTIKVESLTCGGNLLHVLGEGLYKTNTSTKVPCYIVEVLGYNKILPTYEWIKNHPWLITTAVKLNPYGEPIPFPQGRQPDGYQPGVRHPLVCNSSTYPEIVIEKWRVEDWISKDVPDPYKVYSRYG
jgi:hypothetical protein